jgi:hypothetical protein
MEALLKFWPLIYSTLREFWEITEPHIEDAVVKNGIPIEFIITANWDLKFFQSKIFKCETLSQTLNNSKKYLPASM